MTELEKRVKRAKEAAKSFPSWVKRAAVFVGGERLREPKTSHVSYKEA
jgi:hypothetical protein